jgi:hypothetical protein
VLRGRAKTRSLTAQCRPRAVKNWVNDNQHVAGNRVLFPLRCPGPTCACMLWIGPMGSTVRIGANMHGSIIVGHNRELHLKPTKTFDRVYDTKLVQPGLHWFISSSLHLFISCTCLRRTWREALNCSVWIDSHIYINRLGLISRRHENQQKVWKYKYTI